MRATTTAWVGVLAVLAAACGGSPPSAPAPTAQAPAAQPQPAPAPQPLATTMKAPEPPPPPAMYDAKGRRDPFDTLEVRTGTGLSIGTARLVGIVRGNRGPLVLLETAEGLGYILRLGDVLGDGRLTEIGPDSVAFALGPRPGMPVQRVVLRLPAD